MSQYIYRGPASGITLRGAKGTKTEVMLFDGKQVELPDCAEVRTLVALKRLQPVAPAATAASAAAAGAASKAAAPVTSPATSPAAPATADPAVNPATDATASSTTAASTAAPASQKKGA